jgi:hypothetical protein
MGNREFLKMFKCGEFNDGTNNFRNSDTDENDKSQTNFNLENGGQGNYSATN